MSARRWLSDEQIAKLTHTGRLKENARLAREWNGNIEPVTIMSGEVRLSVGTDPQCASGKRLSLAGRSAAPTEGTSGPLALQRREDGEIRKARNGPPPPVSASSGTPIPYPLVRLCRMAGIAEPVPEYRFHPQRKWRFDYAYPLSMLAIEIEGGLWTQGRHSRGAGAIKDLEKYSEAAILGWRIIYATPQELDNGTCLDRVVRALTDKAAA